MRTALLAVASVWVLGCIWSYQEQSAFAASKGFYFPHLLPLVIDGFAVSMAGVAWAASLDARPAVPARLATVVAVAASSASNGVWAYIRANHDMVTVVLGVAVPIAANLAFEVLLAELRRQVQRRRGLPPPVAVPYPRLIRLALAPWQTFRAWRKLVLELTEMQHQVSSSTGHHSLPGEENTAIPAAASVTSVTRDGEAEAPARQATGTPPPALAAAAGAQAGSRSSATHQAADRPAEKAQQPAEPGAQEQTAVIPAVTEERADQPQTQQATAEQNSTSTRRRTSRVRTAGTVPTKPRAVNGSRNGQRPIDPRVEQLAQLLANHEDPDEVTGERVGELLRIDVAPRTGRRLLGQARELVNRRAQEEAEAQGRDPKLSVIGGG